MREVMAEYKGPQYEIEKHTTVSSLSRLADVILLLHLAEVLVHADDLLNLFMSLMNCT